MCTDLFSRAFFTQAPMDELSSESRQIVEAGVTGGLFATNSSTQASAAVFAVIPNDTTFVLPTAKTWIP